MNYKSSLDVILCIIRSVLNQENLDTLSQVFCVPPNRGADPTGFGCAIFLHLTQHRAFTSRFYYKPNWNSLYLKKYHTHHNLLLRVDSYYLPLTEEPRLGAQNVLDDIFSLTDYNFMG